MSKYFRDLDLELVKEVKNLANKYGLSECGVELEFIRLKNKKNAPYGEVLKSSDLVKLYAQKENLVVIALNEELMNLFDEETRTILIENLLEQIVTDVNKDGDIKINIKKPEISVGLGTYHKYQEKVIEKLELVLLTQQQLLEQEELEKAIRKEAKKTGAKVVEK
jgi:hypothetical protein